MHGDAAEGASVKACLEFKTKAKEVVFVKFGMSPVSMENALLNVKKEIPAYMLRHKMKAGITGWAQINGWRGDTSLHKRIEFDISYIKIWSFLLDIKILFLTFWKGFRNKNAY